MATKPQPTQLTHEQIDLARKVEGIYYQEVNYLSAVEYALQKMKREKSNGTSG